MLLKSGDKLGAGISQMELSRYLLLKNDLTAALHNASEAKSIFEECGEKGSKYIPTVEQF